MFGGKLRRPNGKAHDQIENKRDDGVDYIAVDKSAYRKPDRPTQAPEQDTVRFPVAVSICPQSVPDRSDVDAQNDQPDQQGRKTTLDGQLHIRRMKMAERQATAREHSPFTPMLVL